MQCKKAAAFSLFECRLVVPRSGSREGTSSVDSPWATWGVAGPKSLYKPSLPMESEGLLSSTLTPFSPARWDTDKTGGRSLARRAPGSERRPRPCPCAPPAPAPRPLAPDRAHEASASRTHAAGTPPPGATRCSRPGKPRGDQARRRQRFGLPLCLKSDLNCYDAVVWLVRARRGSATSDDFTNTRRKHERPVSASPQADVGVGGSCTHGWSMSNVDSRPTAGGARDTWGRRPAPSASGPGVAWWRRRQRPAPRARLSHRSECFVSFVSIFFTATIDVETRVGASLIARRFKKKRCQLPSRGREGAQGRAPRARPPAPGRTLPDALSARIWTPLGFPASSPATRRGTAEDEEG